LLLIQQTIFVKKKPSQVRRGRPPARR
jgi:hypothetical protein